MHAVYHLSWLLLFTFFHLAVRMLRQSCKLSTKDEKDTDNIILLVCSYENEISARKHNVNIQNKYNSIKHALVQRDHCLINLRVLPTDICKKWQPGIQDHVYLRFSM
jgi:hypothetical protein